MIIQEAEIKISLINTLIDALRKDKELFFIQRPLFKIRVAESGFNFFLPSVRIVSEGVLQVILRRNKYYAAARITPEVLLATDGGCLSVELSRLKKRLQEAECAGVYA